MFRVRFRHPILAFAAAGMFYGVAPAQEQLVNKDQVEQFSKIRFLFTAKVLSGQEPAPAAHYDLASRYYVSRVAYEQAPNDPKTMGLVVKDFEDMIVIATSANNSKANRDAVNKLAPQIVARFKEVFALDWKSNQMAQANAAVLLWHAARLKHDDIGDYLAALLADAKYHDAIRVHAAKGLIEYMPPRAFLKFDLNAADRKQLEARKDREVRRIDALLKFIDRPAPPSTSDSPEMKQMEMDGQRYLRRQAVTSLALAQTPAVSAIDKSGKVEGPVALGLIKVLANKVQPEPMIGERIEAAIGVCLFTKYLEEYDPKIGIYLAGECFADLISEYKRDLPAVTAKGKNKLPTILPWKTLSKRIEIALVELVTNNKGTPNAAATQTLDSKLKPILKSMQNGDGIDREQEFRTFVKSLRPTNTKVLFRNAKGPMLEFDWESTAAAADEK